MSKIDIKEFYNFCANFAYINGCEEERTNCLPIYYNTMLVMGNKRTSFMVQPVDYANISDYEKIVRKILEFDNITCKKHIQGMLFFRTSNINFINMIIDSSPSNQKNLGYILSYPCYNHEWTNLFANLCVEDLNGVHVLFANWCRKLETFDSGTKDMREYLENNYNCKCFIESNIFDKKIM